MTAKLIHLDDHRSPPLRLAAYTAADIWPGVAPDVLRWDLPAWARMEET